MDSPEVHFKNFLELILHKDSKGAHKLMDSKTYKDF